MRQTAWRYMAISSSILIYPINLIILTHTKLLCQPTQTVFSFLKAITKSWLPSRSRVHLRLDVLFHRALLTADWRPYGWPDEAGGSFREAKHCRREWNRYDINRGLHQAGERGKGKLKGIAGGLWGLFTQPRQQDMGCEQSAVQKCAWMVQTALEASRLHTSVRTERWYYCCKCGVSADSSDGLFTEAASGKVQDGVLAGWRHQGTDVGCKKAVEGRAWNGISQWEEWELWE